MRISEIQDKISENNILIKQLQTQVSKLCQENNRLLNEKLSKLVSYFTEYLEIGYVYEVTNNYLYLDGTQTGLKPTETHYSPNFVKGDVFEVVKKNSKSIVIKCTKKIKSIYSNGTYKSEVISNPNWTFRIETQSLYQSFLKDENFADSFKKYVTRRESLDIIGI